MTRDQIFDTLERVAIESPGVRSNIKVAAAIVYRRRIISIGVNQYKSHTLMKKYGRNSDSIFLHAEVDAVRKALPFFDVEKFKKCDLYILRVKKDRPNCKSHWIRGLAKPCPGCSRLIEDYQFRNVFYTFDEDVKEFA